jgi:hypothetical protein
MYTLKADNNGTNHACNAQPPPSWSIFIGTVPWHGTTDATTVTVQRVVLHQGAGPIHNTNRLAIAVRLTVNSDRTPLGSHYTIGTVCDATLGAVAFCQKKL